MMLSTRAVTAAALLACSVSGFSVNPTTLQKKSSPYMTKTSLAAIRCENKYYQFEEMEDKDNCTTELFLTEDGRVEFGETDGPRWVSVEGRWFVKEGTDDFKMEIRKKFKTGNDGSDMGEFEYEIYRCYIGDMIKVGDSVAITGVMHSTDEPGSENDLEVGFFNMIDGTDVREDRRPDARVGTSASS